MWPDWVKKVNTLLSYTKYIKDKTQIICNNIITGKKILFGASGYWATDFRGTIRRRARRARRRRRRRRARARRRRAVAGRGRDVMAKVWLDGEVRTAQWPTRYRKQSARAIRSNK